MENDTQEGSDVNVLEMKENNDKTAEVNPINEVGTNVESCETPMDTSADQNDIILASESLRMSDSEDEEVQKVSPVRNRRGRVAKIVDSDSDDDTNNRVEEKKELFPERSGRSAVIDSESEPDTEKTESVQTQKTKSKKFSALIDSDSEPETSERQSEGDESPKKKNRGLVGSDGNTADEETNEENNDDDNEGRKKKFSTLIDSESEPEDETGLPEEEMLTQDNEESGKKQGKQKPEKVQRKSAKKAMDEFMAIKSETQRLQRENRVSIPYHKPKRHTLKEFLTRHTVPKPEEVIKDKAKSKLKMTPDELVEFAKRLEERAKEATEFFKSESEDEDELKDYNPESFESKENETETVGDATTTVSTQECQSGQETEGNELRVNKVLDETNLLETVSEKVSDPAPEKPVILNIENLKKLIDYPEITQSPTLKGGPNMVIDLETGDLMSRKPSGVDRLLERFLKTSSIRKPKESEAMSIVSTENGKLDISKVDINLNRDVKPEKDIRPGAAYLKLKQNLREIISKKRRDGHQKKLEDNREEEDEMKKCFDDGEESEENELSDDETMKNDLKKKERKLEEIRVNDEEEIEEDVGEMNEDMEIEDENLEDNNEINDEVNEQSESDSDADDEDDDDDEEETAGSSKSKKHRIISAFQDSDDEADDKEKNDTSTGELTSQNPLFANEADQNLSDVENELLDLCSGRFAATQKNSFISQIPTTQMPENGGNDDELLELCSGTFQTEVQHAPETSATINCQKIISSDEEGSSKQDEANQKVKKSKKKRKNRKLGFSDDEEDDEEVVVEEKESEVEEDIEEEPETFVDYDSEENEIEVKLTKEDRTKKAANFLENEAELSESEWGSADEDEKDLDRYDIELGDEDEFDTGKIQKELEQIHVRKMLDKDARELKKIQELLFDDEENDGVGRQRQFKWKNNENGFSLDDPTGQNEAEAGGDADDSGDEENEAMYRKMRFEREVLYKDKVNEIAKNDLTMTNSPSCSILKNITINSKPSPLVSATNKTNSPFLISMAMNKSKPMRGSFLNLDEQSLERLAAMTSKQSLVDPDGTEGTVLKPVNASRNLVFATITKEEHELQQKRKAGNMESLFVAASKKPKLSNPGPKCLIDKLL